jgi:hypothetical protein
MLLCEYRSLKAITDSQTFGDKIIIGMCVHMLHLHSQLFLSDRLSHVFVQVRWLARVVPDHCSRFAAFQYVVDSAHFGRQPQSVVCHCRCIEGMFISVCASPYRVQIDICRRDQIVGLYWSIFCLLVIIVCYPFFKCCLACEPVDAVAIRRINSRIHDIVVEKKLLTSSPPDSSKHASIEMVLCTFLHLRNISIHSDSV